jgi:hypothetical protein
MNCFHVNVFAEPRRNSFTASWDEAAHALGQMPRMIFEPDGSFILSGDDRGVRWQVDGHLFDFDDRLYRVELRGQCPVPTFEDLLRCVGWPAQQVEFEMVREGTTLSEAAFRRALLH